MPRGIPLRKHPLDRPLQIAERSCLLRAARRELSRLKDEHDHLQSIQGAAEAAQSVDAEVDCLLRATSWLWRYQSPEPPH